MPQISIIKKSDILEARRFDAEYFKPEYLQEERLLEKKGFFILKKISDVRGGKRLPLEENFSDEGVPYIRAEDVKNGFVDYENTPRISKELHKKLINYQTKKNDVLLTIVGNSIGDVGFVEFDLEKCNLTENASKITNLKEINPETLFVYMLSKYGQNQIHREKVGTAQPKLALERIRRFRIPKYTKSFQLQVKEKIKFAYQKQTKSKKLYQEAEQLLLEELGLVDHKPKHQLIFETTKKETEQSARFDAEYFQPKYVEIIEKIENYAILSLADKKSFKIITGAYTKKYSSEGDYYIRSVNINDDLTIDTEDMYYTEEKLDPKFRIKTGDIITSRVGSIGTLGIISEKLDDGFVSDNILRIRNLNKKLDNLFLAFYLKRIGTIFMERLQRGSVQQRLNQETLKEIILPIININKQKEIANIIIHSQNQQNKSKSLLEIAKKSVEIAIEKDERLVNLIIVKNEPEIYNIENTRFGPCYLKITKLCLGKLKNNNCI